MPLFMKRFTDVTNNNRVSGCSGSSSLTPILELRVENGSLRLSACDMGRSPLDPEGWKALLTEGARIYPQHTAIAEADCQRPATKVCPLSAVHAGGVLFMPPIISRLLMISSPRPRPADSSQTTLHPCNLILYSMH